MANTAATAEHHARQIHSDFQEIEGDTRMQCLCKLRLCWWTMLPHHCLEDVRAGLPLPQAQAAL